MPVMKVSFITFVLAIIYASAAPTVQEAYHVVHEKRSEGVGSWREHSSPAGDETILMKVLLKQTNLEHAERLLHEISDPDSEFYGKHWSSEQVANFFAPLADSRAQVAKWLLSSGFDRTRLRETAGRGWIEFNATIAEAERLLQTKYHIFEHDSEGVRRTGCNSYSVPHHVRDHIDFIMPTIILDGPKPQALSSLGSPAHSSPAYTGLHGLKYCHEVVTIPCLRALYNFGKGNHSFSNNMLGIPEFADYLYLPDLDLYFKNFTDPQIPVGTHPNFISIDGGPRSNLSLARQGFSLESAGDFQEAYSIVWPQQLNQYQVGDGVNLDSVGTFNIFLDALDGSYCQYEGGDTPYIDPTYPDDFEGGWLGNLQCGGAPKSSVLSVSYGQIEAALPVTYQQRQCYEWAKLGLQGTSVVFASGDAGVANEYNGVGYYKDTCVNPKWHSTDVHGTQFSPSFPVNCPFVTSVGMTRLKGPNLTDGEMAASSILAEYPNRNIASGGGFSNVFPRPAWQSEAATTYLTHYAPDYNSSVFNRSGRGFPDVSAIGWNIGTMSLGKIRTIAGTSGSTPIFASILNLLNGERLAANKTTIGFVNPILYKHPEMFNDITEGSNPGCGTKGFSAVPGWDPVTGLGTPNYEKM